MIISDGNGGLPCSHVMVHVQTGNLSSFAFLRMIFAPIRNCIIVSVTVEYLGENNVENDQSTMEMEEIVQKHDYAHHLHFDLT